MLILNACNSDINAEVDESALPSSVEKIFSSENSYPDSFKPDDKEYPYADIPRIVIETENRTKIKDRETEIPAKLQIWGKKEAESEIVDLTIRGRGNTSWGKPKKSYKIEFVKKQSMLGMPKDKDWALIANYTDKTLMRNYIAYRLSAALGAYYAPRCEFAELYLNGEYLGVYLLTETIKIGENRIDIPKNDCSYIVEVDKKYRTNEQVVFSDVLTENGTGMPYRVHDPKNATVAALDSVQNQIQKFEKFLKKIKLGESKNLEEWIDVDESIKHYWAQEFTKNPDAEFYTSVYFSWVRGQKIKMGPVWDFDLAFGNHSNEQINLSENWHLRKYWNSFLFKDSLYKERVVQYWIQNRNLFVDVLDSVYVCQKKLKKAAENNLKKWVALKKDSLDTYDNAVENLREWINERIQWIDSRY